MKKTLLFLILLQPLLTLAQNFQWFDPVRSPFPVIDGRGWHKELASDYDRFPAVAEKNLRPAVWNLSRNSAGEYIGFTTNSKTVVVKYAVKGSQSMPHMPSTGVAGVDLYALDKNGNWQWAKGSWKFGDTITYRFENMVLSQTNETFRLYLPLYTSVQWMQIGVPEGSSFEAQQISSEKPIVAYGTSIMHGACATRPGLAWTNILGRKLKQPLINLGFSGNGQLEPAVIDLINSIDASLYILDCMPNLTLREQFPAEEIEKRIRNSVNALQSKHPGVPIVLAEHCSGLQHMNMDSVMTARYVAASEIAAAVYKKMKKEGTKNFYLLTAKDIGFTTESTVDGTHPNDIGMMQYAEAYEKLIRRIARSKYQ
jgi:lysophospholipase L1-like esterase